MVGLMLNEAKSELEPFQISSFWGLGYTWIRGELPSQYPKLGDNSTCMPNIVPENIAIHRSVPIHGITQLGLRSHPIGLSTFDAPTMTFSLIRPDKPVYTTMSISPFRPCHPTRAMAGPIVSHVRNPYPTFPGGVHDFYVCLYLGQGRLQPTVDTFLHARLVHAGACQVASCG